MLDRDGNTLIKTSYNSGQYIVRTNDGRELKRKRANVSMVSYLNKDEEAALAYYYDLDNERNVVVIVRDSTLSPVIELIILEQWSHEKKPFSGTGNARKRNAILASLSIATILAVIRLAADDADDSL